MADYKAKYKKLKELYFALLAKVEPPKKPAVKKPAVKKAAVKKASKRRSSR